jgi:hypothetical protein
MTHTEKEWAKAIALRLNDEWAGKSEFPKMLNS